eukprot:4903630-Amphidinium_carterae.1
MAVRVSFDDWLREENLSCAYTAENGIDNSYGTDAPEYGTLCGNKANSFQNAVFQNLMEQT